MNILDNISAFQNLIYIAASILFITGIKMLGKEDTAVKGNFLSALAMLIAVVITFLDPDVQVNPYLILAGIGVGATVGSLIALKVKMTSIPEMVALFNGFGGLATFFIAWSEFNSVPDNTFQYVLIMLTTYIGGVTFSGSIVAYGKLSEKLKIQKTSIITKFFTTIFYVSIIYLIYSILIANIFIPPFDFFIVLLALTLLGGIGFVIPIGGGDMPVVISLLNSFSGIAAAFAGLLVVMARRKRQRWCVACRARGNPVPQHTRKTTKRAWARGFGSEASCNRHISVRPAAHKADRHQTGMVETCLEHSSVHDKIALPLLL